MPTQRARFGFPVTRIAKPTLTIRTLDLTKGLDLRDPPQIAQSISIGNFEKVGKGIRVRSGLSAYDNTFTQGSGALWGSMVYGADGARAGVFASPQTVSWITAETWSHLSYVAGTPAGEVFDSSVIAGIDGTYIYDLARDGNIAVITNNRQEPKFFDILPTNETFSDFTWVTSLFSRAAAVEAFDSRLVWFNVASSASTFPTRVAWSARGEPTNYATADGAGFVDLMDMRGTGQNLVRYGDEIFLFSDEEIWAGRARGDLYAFDFRRISAEIGCPHPRTIASTPLGIAFLGSDHEVYLLRDGALHILGGDSSDQESRVRKYIRENITLDRNAWGVYNPVMHRYELYLTIFASTFYPSFSLHYVFDNGSWWFHTTGFEGGLGATTSAGFYWAPTDGGLTWDAVGSEWDDFPVTWDEADALHEDNRRIVVSTSDGTPVVFHPSATSDLGFANTATLAVPVMNSPQEMFDRMLIRDVFLDYDYIPSSGEFSSVASISITNGGEGETTAFHAAVLQERFGTAHVPLLAEARYPYVLLSADFSDKTARYSRIKVSLSPSGSPF